MENRCCHFSKVLLFVICNSQCWEPWNGFEYRHLHCGPARHLPGINLITWQDVPDILLNPILLFLDHLYRLLPFQKWAYGEFNYLTGWQNIIFSVEYKPWLDGHITWLEGHITWLEGHINLLEWQLTWLEGHICVITWLEGHATWLEGHITWLEGDITWPGEMTPRNLLCV